MSIQNKENTRDLVSENELEGTTIKTFSQGTALSNFTYGDLNKTLIHKNQAKLWTPRMNNRANVKWKQIESASVRSINQRTYRIISYRIISYRVK